MQAGNNNSFILSQAESDDLGVAERLHINGRIVEVADELLESSRQHVPEIIEERFDQNFGQVDNNRTHTVKNMA